jgi:EAL domain-containing protein (putative c-di-GMP-specific phosphodiesterase class I)
VLAWHQPDRRGEVPAAVVLPAVGQHARRDRADTWNRQKALAELVIGQLPREILVELADLFAEVLKMGAQAFEDGDQAPGAANAQRALWAGA